MTATVLGVRVRLSLGFCHNGHCTRAAYGQRDCPACSAKKQAYRLRCPEDRAVMAPRARAVFSAVPLTSLELQRMRDPRGSQGSICGLPAPQQGCPTPA
jgi:hypothetical protein